MQLHNIPLEVCSFSLQLRVFPLEDCDFPLQLRDTPLQLRDSSLQLRDIYSETSEVFKTSEVCWLSIFQALQVFSHIIRRVSGFDIIHHKSFVFFWRTEIILDKLAVDQRSFAQIHPFKIV